MDATSTEQLSTALIRSGLLTNQFEQLRRLEESSASRGFVADLAKLFLSDSAGRIQKMEEIAVNGNGMNELQRLANQMLGSSDTFGAAVVAGHCKALSEALSGSFELRECLGWLECIKSEVGHLKPLLELYITLDGAEQGSEGSANSGNSQVHISGISTNLSAQGD